jgi:hypothetical protein
MSGHRGGGGSVVAATVQISLQGYLTPSALKNYFKKAEFEMRRASPVLVDATGMTGYDDDCRHWFLYEFGRDYDGRVGKMAVLTRRTMWRVVVATLNLVVGKTFKTIKVRCFEERADAEAWLASE